MNARRKLIARSAALAWPATALLAPAPALSQSAASFPARPIRFVVPFAAGSGADSGARAYGEVIARLWGQAVQVENRPGASGAVAALAVKSAPADGHTVFIGTNSPMAVNPVLSKSLPYDPFKDFRPVHGMLVGTAAFIVKGDSPIRSLRDLLEAARRDRKTLNVGSYSEGYMLVARWLGLVAGVPINYVNYKGGVQSQTDVAGGQLDLGVNDLSGTAARHHRRQARSAVPRGAHHAGAGLCRIRDLYLCGLFCPQRDARRHHGQARRGHPVCPELT